MIHRCLLQLRRGIADRRSDRRLLSLRVHHSADDVDGGYFFPDYPKYGVWSNSYILTTREFGWVDRYGISVYALEKNKMVNGEPNARAVQFFLEANVTRRDRATELVGDGLLPPIWTVNRRPMMAPRHRL